MYIVYTVCFILIVCAFLGTHFLVVLMTHMGVLSPIGVSSYLENVPGHIAPTSAVDLLSCGL